MKSENADCQNTKNCLQKYIYDQSVQTLDIYILTNLMSSLSKQKLQQLKKMYPESVAASQLETGQIDSIKDQFKNRISRPWQLSNSMKIKNQIDRLCHRYLQSFSDADIKQIVNVVYELFKTQRRLEGQIVYLRFLHEMIVHYQRFRFPITEVILIVYSQVICEIQNANKKYMLNELKIMYRLWYSYLDLYTLRKIRQYTYVEARMDIEMISVADLPLMKQISEFPKYLRERILNPVGPHAANFAEVQDYFKENQKGYYKWKMQSKQKKYEKDCPAGKNQAQLFQIQKQKQQKSNAESQATLDKNNKQEKVQSSEQNASSGKQSLVKLKQMYNKLKSLKVKRKASKQLLQDGVIQPLSESQESAQIIMKSLTVKQLRRYEEEWENFIEQQWNYPFGEDQTNDPENRQSLQKTNKLCKFCFQQLQIKQEHGVSVYKQVVCFYITRPLSNKFKANLPCFKITAKESKLKEGVFVMHGSCYSILLNGRVDESKWEVV